MKIINSDIPDIKIIEPTKFEDSRGFFMESFRRDWFKDNIANYDFVQENHSKSEFGVLRGLHYQISNPQGKLVRVISGEVFDVAVDLRSTSKTFGRYFGKILSSDNKHQMWIPPGFAHGFLVLSKNAEFVYKCTDYYSPQYERSILWEDEYLQISWPIPSNCELKLSEKDIKATKFKDATYY